MHLLKRHSLTLLENQNDVIFRVDQTYNMVNVADAFLNHRTWVTTIADNYAFIDFKQSAKCLLLFVYHAYVWSLYNLVLNWV